ncbi:bifunctional phosphopantothenoylcysteine decarboxylase/phosphopantothenate--cysteine ligase CoaBC [Thorsellia anophelis]|uniref:Coenzyme A biosynthesis bifunctional protein CoaBC n=1 Tax=Thorsellia anophelis DSM 18579 TaxID=1123402 RepID=A0A1I0BBX1_9GAMM|nr:bifunctional phosphopantothenoylcysteine decarboxylase/phosphopantothenate--cysteine ligase CoaBC [Thorsellia anophelis]SET03614.1 Phosphopantothenate-cysteine ligase [Thorsellia anophelis DSM 18579]
MNEITQHNANNSGLPLADFNCLIGITGGIAAYKIPEVVRRLKDQGANVRVVMTKGAEAFITPLTLQAVSGNPVSIDLLDPQAEAAMGHIELAKWADLVVIAPASADFIGRMSAGLANDLLTTLCLATSAPIAIVPAMNQQMYASKLVQSNIQRLKEVAEVDVWGPDSGAQACGDVGMGRMIAPDEIVNFILNAKASNEYMENPIQDFAGLSILLTAGPTRESIDPVRYITNHSSGKMGFALAEIAAKRGATVTLITGPVNLSTPDRVKRIDVQSAEEMFTAVKANLDGQDIFIGTAAVADYRVDTISQQKLKKQPGQSMLNLTLVQNPDIIRYVGHVAQNRPFVIGFAAETENIQQYALNKLVTKKLDMICANDVSQSHIGFNSDENALTVYWDNSQAHIPIAPKQAVANELMTLILRQFHAS